ncbi:MAG: hypothetical protein LBI14_11955 [Treponema sp.]|jgi:hypothetical protein|nr:hypothetical protein [Treponema sp.]
MPNKAKFFLLAIFLIFAQFIFAQSGERYYENVGNFSYCPPLNWNITEFPGLKYHIIIGSVDGNSTANINFADEVYSGKLDEYVSLSIAQLEQFFASTKLISRDPFKTNSGIVGERIIITNIQLGNNLMQFIYFLQMPNNRYLVISATALESTATNYQPIFDECVRTFEIMP